MRKHLQNYASNSLSIQRILYARSLSTASPLSFKQHLYRTTIIQKDTEKYRNKKVV